jgi:uncharacterized protein YkwD
MNFRHALLLALSLVLAATSSVNSFAAPAPHRDSYYEEDPDSGRVLGYNNEMEQEIIALTNAERSDYGKPAFQAVSYLNVAAQKHAINMARQHMLEHDLDGMSPGDRISSTGYRWAGYAENIASGYNSAAGVMRGWMNSPGHMANILDTSEIGTTQIGVGVATASDGTMFFCQEFALPQGGKDYDRD